MEVALVATTRANAPVLDTLLQLYEYDFSEYGEIDVDPNGAFPTSDTRTLWQPGRYVFLIRAAGKLAGAHGNVAAQAFWRTVFGRYQNGMYREIPEGCDRWPGPIWTFETGS